jgi:hypothetical protein
MSTKNIRTYKPAVRLKSKPNGPLRSVNNYQFGFYDIGVMRQCLELSDSNEYRIAALPIPQTEDEFKVAESIIKNPAVEYALVDKNKLVVALLDGAVSNGWMSNLTDLGYVVKGGGKAAKRMKSFHRPTLINAHYENLNILIVEDTDYTIYDLDDHNNIIDELTDPSIRERLLDGCFVVSDRIMHQGIANLPVYEPHNTTDTDEYFYDPNIRHQLQGFLAKSKVFNGRLIYKDGTLKGNFIVSSYLPEDVDVISSSANLKTEVKYMNGYRLLAEPQGPKSRVITDDQTVINFPKLFRKSDMEMWLKEEYEKMFQDATSGKLLQNWKTVYTRLWRDGEDIEDKEVQARMSYVAYRWVAAGLSITDSPWLFENLASSHAMPLQKRIPIPCSVYEQIIPESIARMAGYDIEVETETIQRINEIGVHVVNDLDWLEMYESHGGHDADDFFKLFYRTIEGGFYDEDKVVIAVRSPNGKGEYTIFRYVEGQWSPTWTKSDGTKIKFPTVNGRGWTTRLSTAIRFNKVSYTGLPSKHNKSTAHASESYDHEQVLADLRAAMNGGNVGRYVNAVMLHSMVFTEHRKTQLCSLEDAIDGCTQTADPADRTAIDEEARKLVREVIESGRPVDRAFWQSRNFTNSLKDGESVEFYDGKITQIYDLCNQYFVAYRKRINLWAQQNARPDDIVHDIGKRLYFHALPYLRRFRMNIYNANAVEVIQPNATVQRDTWESLYDNIVDVINSFDSIQDQHDFVISLYSASLKVPTSGGKISDQIVMNRLVFPYLEKALQHYGIAKRVIIERNEDGTLNIQQMKSDTWTYTPEDGQPKSFTDILEYQKFHAKYSKIVHTTSTR